MAIGELAGGRSDADEQPTRDFLSLAEPASRTLALVDLRQDQGALQDATPDTSRLFRLALEQIEHAVRGQDRVCPFATFMVAVSFGSDANVVSTKALGERLARAVRHCTPPDGALSVGTSRSHSRADGITPQTIGDRTRTALVTVDRTIGRNGSPMVLASDAAGQGSDRALLPVGALRRRTVVRCVIGDFARYGTRHDDILPGGRGTILVVSPSRVPSGTPGIAAAAASTMAERLGYDVGTVALMFDDEPVLDVRGAAVELVAVMVGGEREPSNGGLTWLSSTWNVPAQLVATFRAQGLPVLAVGAGGGAGALASCAAEGASVVLDLDELQTVLQEGATPLPVLTSTELVGNEVPRQIQSLALLTASERRVLFYLTIGRSAQDIADDQILSVTTVRSHIRSILRKLGVRSQLAAVAIANSQDLNRTKPTGLLGDTRGEVEIPGVA